MKISEPQVGIEPTTAQLQKSGESASPYNSSEIGSLATERPESAPKWPPAIAIDRNGGHVVIRDEDTVRADLQKKLSALVDQARLTTSTTPFLAKQIAEILDLAAAGIVDTDRLVYVAADHELWRSLYDLAEPEGGRTFTSLHRLEYIRGLIDSLHDIDVKRAAPVAVDCAGGAAFDGDPARILGQGAL